MKLEIEERGSKKYYDEFLFLAFNYKKISNNPHGKIHGLTMSGYLYCGISLVLTLLMMILYIMNKGNIYIYLTIFFSVILIISVLYILMILNKIKKSIATKGISSFEITKSYVCIEANGKSLQLNFDEIKFILLGKYTINFIPNDITKPFITTNIIYKEEVINTLRKYKKDNLIIYN